MKFEVFRNKKNKKYSFELKTSKNVILLYSQAYVSKAGCLKGIQSVRKNSSNPDKFESKEEKAKKSSFVLKARNGEIIGESSVYLLEKDRKVAIKNIIKGASKAKLEFV